MKFIVAEKVFASFLKSFSFVIDWNFYLLCNIAKFDQMPKFSTQNDGYPELILKSRLDRINEPRQDFSIGK
jgi:hypothetical protein